MKEYFVVQDRYGVYIHIGEEELTELEVLSLFNVTAGANLFHSASGNYGWAVEMVEPNGDVWYKFNGRERTYV